MPFLPRLVSTLRSLFDQRRLDTDLDEELRSYLSLRVEELAASGVDPAEAARRARLELGIDQVREQVRDSRRGAVLDTVARDARLGVRLLVRAPGFAAAAILTLAIGVGCTTAAFSVVHASLIRRLPFPEPERLVMGEKTFDGRAAGWVSRLDYYDFRDSNRSFVSLAAIVDGTSSCVITGGTEPMLAKSALVTSNLFPTLGVSPALGRGFLPAEELVPDARVVVISHALWQRRFAGAAGAVGATLRVNGQPLTVVGIMPAGFRYLEEADLWQLVTRTGPVDLTRDSHSHIMIGRLGSGVSLSQAQQDLDLVARSLAERYPDTNRRKGIRLSPLHDRLVAHVRRGLLMLMAVTTLVLLVACANVAGLLLSRGQQRLPEMAMRAALGASRSRLVSQLLAETVILSVAGGLIGLAIARSTLVLLAPVLSTGSVAIAAPALNLPVLVFALAISTVAAVLIGLVPAIRGTAVDPGMRLGNGRSQLAGRGGIRLRSILVVAQVAASVVLLVVSGLFVRSLIRANSVDLGFDPDRVLTATLRVPTDSYPTRNARLAFVSALIEHLGTVPGVEAVSGVSKLPVFGRATDWPVRRADLAPTPRESQISPLARWVLPRYFETMGMTLLRGRDFTMRDTAGAPKVIILTESTARALFGTADPLGRSLNVWGQEGAFEVIGVAADAVLESPVEGKSRAMYMSALQIEYGIGALTLRAHGDLGMVAAAVRKVTREMNPNVLIAADRTLRTIVDEALVEYRTVIQALAVFAVAALVLACVGLYGALSYHVSQQQHELGVRMAVGASSMQVLWLVLGRGVGLAATGMALGGGCSIAASRLIRTQLFDTPPFDGVTYAGATVLLAVVAALASLLPARRAARIDPVSVLRGE